MKALTIQQPYAHLIALPDDHDDAKRAENRTWPTSYRGLLAIHAGKGKDYLVDGDMERWPGMAFGAIVAVAKLADCVHVTLPYACHGGGKTINDAAKRRWPWLLGHKHLEGPYGFVLTEVRAVPPIPCRGAQGLWDVPFEILKKLKETPHLLRMLRADPSWRTALQSHGLLGR